MKEFSYQAETFCGSYAGLIPHMKELSYQAETFCGS